MIDGVTLLLDIGTLLEIGEIVALILLMHSEGIVAITGRSRNEGGTVFIRREDATPHLDKGRRQSSLGKDGTQF